MQLLSENLLAFRDSGRASRPDRRILRPSPRLAVVRPQRGMRPALRLSRLEIRRDRPMRRSAVRAGGDRHSRSGSSCKSYPMIEQAACCGPIWARPSTNRACPEFEFALVPPGAALRLETAAVMQLVAGAGGRHRLQPRLVPASRRAALRSADAGARGDQYNMARHDAGVRGRGASPAACSSARGAMPAGSNYWRITPWCMPSFTMIAPRGDHPVHGHFWMPIDDENCWAWSFDYHPTPRADRGRGRGDAGGKGIHVKYDSRHLHSGRQRDNDYLMDRAAQKAGRTYQRRRRHRACRTPRCRKAWVRSSTARKRTPDLDRQRHHHGAAAADCGPPRHWRNAASHRRAPIRRRIACVRPLSSCRGA